ncbi:hypothetical protein [Bizionia arctica]|uniref:Neuromedin U n=1 Tax=Bizionia arctica TaxID=1495645 RepID=A0A917GI66_9FLAO|nr:hypothetical protein [Bizionia arctica]GGG47288.1 hypothetical protein GCM10010976_18400 [Bizionia arctica]
MKKLNYLLCLLLLSSVSIFAQEEKPAATDSASDLEKKIQNPIASMISVPIQNNVNFGVGPYNRTQNTTNIQPVIPISINDKFNLISRTIIPLISQPVGEHDSEYGLGDISLSLFLTPKKATKLIYGGGVAVGIPTATSDYLGTDKWSAGPSVVLLVQPKGWTIGGILQNTWSFAGSENAADVNYFYSQIFAVKNLPKKWYINTAPIITANWEATSGNQWTVPLGAGFGKLVRVGKLPINAQAGYYYNVVRPDNGPESQLRIQVAFLFPN